MGGGSWRYAWGARRRPYVHPLCSPAGDVLTVDAPADHPWHHGLWFAIKFVNGENFWEEYGEYGVVRHDGPPEVGSTDDTAWLRGTLRWVRPDRTTMVLRERRTLAHVPIDDHAYAIDWTVELVPEVDVVLDRTPFTTWGGYGGLTLRGRPDWHDTRLLLPDGSERDRVLGDRAPWCDLAGPVGSHGRSAGVLLLDHPSNPSHPTPWYASTRADTYGDEGWSNFCNAALLWDGPLEVPAGEHLAIRHRAVVHDDVWSPARCGAEATRWLAPGSPPLGRAVAGGPPGADTPDAPAVGGADPRPAGA